MTLGEVGDQITNKETSERYILHTKHEDGWVVTDPEIEKEMAAKLEKGDQPKDEILQHKRSYLMSFIYCRKYEWDQFDYNPIACF
jgi:hypothetical protein